MDIIITLAIWGAAIYTSYIMAKDRGRKTEWAIIGGILFGWFTPLYYLLKGKTPELIIKQNNK